MIRLTKWAARNTLPARMSASSASRCSSNSVRRMRAASSWSIRRRAAVRSFEISVIGGPSLGHGFRPILIPSPLRTGQAGLAKQSGNDEDDQSRGDDDFHRQHQRVPTGTPGEKPVQVRLITGLGGVLKVVFVPPLRIIPNLFFTENLRVVGRPREGSTIKGHCGRSKTQTSPGTARTWCCRGSTSTSREKNIIRYALRVQAVRRAHRSRGLGGPQ